ncbi:ARL14 effector protein [Lamellibrachia satsuma]|nr:ARL14 effector protein [Lamellibrachia satsuma]
MECVPCVVVDDENESSRESHEHSSDTRSDSHNLRSHADENSCDSVKSAAKQLKMLAFRNPGRFMENFDPDRSAREMRKVNRRIYRDCIRKNQTYDDRGRLLMDSRDICDCLEPNCLGCHFDCTKCGSPKCGPECRRNRRWYYQDVEVEGANHKIHFNNPPGHQ